MDLVATQSSPEVVRAFLERHRTGLLTLMFTDVVNSMLLKHQLGDQEGVRRLQEHHAGVREVIAQFPEAREIGTAGDSFLVMFTKPSDAVRCALLIQARLRLQAQALEHPVLDRIGIHVGEVFIQEGGTAGGRRDLYGIQVDTCARVMSLASADQILLTRFAFDNARQVLRGQEIPTLGALSWLDYGPYELEGVEGHVEICEVGERGRAFLRPPTGSKHARRVERDDDKLVTGWRPALGQQVPGTQWTLQAKLADGMLGEVWLGGHPELKQQRVFKFCFDAERVRALKREVALFRLLRERVGEHPHIVRLLEVFFDAPPYYIVTEYVEGKDLKSWWAERKSLAHVPLAVRLELVAQAADALQAAHDAGVIHCDVKPSNILIEFHGDDPRQARAKLADFGISRAMTEEGLAELTIDEAMTAALSSTASASGTQLYLAPERLAGQPPSIRADIYSLGVVLYQLLVDDLTRPVAVDWTRSVPDELLREDLERCFAGNPNERFSSAGELAQNLRQLEERRSQAAQRQADIQRRERAAYRRGMLRTAVIAAVVVGVVALLALAALRSGQRAVKERNRADTQALQARQHSLESQLRLERMNVAYGVQLMEQKDLLGAVQRFASAWQLAVARGDPADVQRVRVAAFLRQSPRLVQFWSVDSPVNDLHFSPGGRWLATGHEDGTARLWDTASGRLVGTPLRCPQGVELVVFSPQADRLVTLGHDREVRVWDAASGQPAMPPLALPEAATCAEFTPDGRALVAADEGGHVRVWAIPSGRLLAEPAGHSRTVWDAAVSPDGRLLATASADHTARLWRMDTAEPAAPPLAHRELVLRVTFSPDGRRVLTASHDGTAAVWDVQTGVKRHELRHRTWLTDARFSPDGRRILTTSFDATARLWDAETGIPTGPPIRHQHSVMAGRFSGDGGMVLTACFDQAARVWDADTGELLFAPLKHSGYVRLAEFDHAGRRVVTLGGDGVMRLWDLASEEPVMPAIVHHAGVSGLALSDDGRRLATASKDGTARVWDTATLQPRGPALPHASEVTRVAFQPNGTLLLTTQADGPAQLWPLENPSPVPMALALEGTARFAAFSADGRRVLAASRSNWVGVFDPATGRALQPAWAAPQPLTAAGFSPAGDRVVLGFKDGRASVCDALTGQPVTAGLEQEAEIAHAEFSADGRWVALASSDSSFDPRSARVWDAQTGAPVSQPFRHFDGVRQATLSHNGEFLATASEDGTAAVWRVSSNALAVPFLRHDYQVNAVAFNADARLVATASRDGTARVWETATGEPVTPPLRHGASVNQAMFTTDGWLVTACEDGQVSFWNLRPTEMTPTQAVALAELLNSRRLDATGGLVPGLAADQRAAWDDLRLALPRAFVVPDEAPRNWRYQQAQDAVRAGDWTRARQHLDSLAASDPGAWRVFWQRANVLSNLALWTEAVADLTRVLELDPGHAGAYRARADIFVRHLNRPELAVRDREAAAKIAASFSSLTRQTSNP